MKSSIFLVLFLFSCSAVALTQSEVINSIKGNYCQDEVRRFVAKRFGPEVEVTKIFHILAIGGMTHYVYFQLNICDALFGASFRGDMWQCINPQAHARTQFMIQVFLLSGECRRFFPQNEYPLIFN